MSDISEFQTGVVKLTDQQKKLLKGLSEGPCCISAWERATMQDDIEFLIVNGLATSWTVATGTKLWRITTEGKKALR